jgi:hypothetical protein
MSRKSCLLDRRPNDSMMKLEEILNLFSCVHVKNCTKLALQIPFLKENFNLLSGVYAENCTKLAVQVSFLKEVLNSLS